MATGSRELHALPRKPMLARVGFALAVSLAALAAQLALVRVWDSSAYSILVGAVAVAVWYGGFVPGLVCAALTWAGAAVIVVANHEQLELTAREAWVQWAISLAVALVMIWVSFVLRRGRALAAEAAEVAEESAAGLESLQQLSSALSAAASVSDVITALVEQAPPVIGAPVALGFVEEGEIIIAQPQDSAAAPWQIQRLTQGRMLHRTASEGRLLRAIGREQLEAMFPDTASLAPAAQGAIAVPLRVEGRVIGSIGFVFDRAEDVHEDAGTLALVVAGLGGQALERARLFESEQESRRGLDRILRVAPRFFTGSESVVTHAICREARTVFGSDVAMLWRVDGDQLSLSAFDPELEPLRPGLRSNLDDFPRLKEAVSALNVSFVPDVREEARGAGLARVRMLGSRSSLRVPVVIAGQAELVLVMSWQNTISRPDSSTLVLVRRFADQAGLALEQVERRRAEAEATRRASEARRLHEMTAALANAATPAEVGAVCLEHARAAAGAAGGLVVRASAEGTAGGIIARTGSEDRGDAESDELSLAAEEPIARVIASGEPIWEHDRAGTGPEPSRPGERRWIVLPLRTGSRVLGAVQLTFHDKPHLSPDTRDRLESIVSQCALALERSFLLDSEHRLRRLSERLQAMTAELSNTLTRADVADVLLAHVDEAVGTECAVLAALGDGLHLTELLGWSGYEPEVAQEWLEASLAADTPQGQALRRLAPLLHHAPGADDVTRRGFDPADTGHSSFLFAPLVLGRRPMALLIASASDPLTLDAEELRFVDSLAGVAAQALDRARRFESEQTTAETLQRSVLPASLPHVAGVQLAGRYLPGTAELEVGGDWYDTILLQNGRLALVVGDVVGKGVRAAATMGQLRNAIRAFSLDRLKPASTLERLSRLADEVIETSFATLVYADLDPATGVCRYASAGHPPPLAVYPDGRAEYLEGGRGLPLGTGVPASYRQGVVELPHGGVLLFYTDGLIERRGRVLDEGLERLRESARSGPRHPDTLVEHVLRQLIGNEERRDDVVLLAARLLPVAPHRLDLRLGGGRDALLQAREALRYWLAGAPADEIEAHDIVLSVWEACANATEHGHSEAGFRLCAELAGDAVTVVVDDSGGWIPSVEASSRGRGLQLMRSLMSSVEIEPGSPGTKVTLAKSLARAVEPPLKTAR